MANVQAGEKWRLGVEHSERGYFYVEAVGARPDGGTYLLGPFPRAIADEIIANRDGMAVLREALETLRAAVIKRCVLCLEGVPHDPKFPGHRKPCKFSPCIREQYQVGEHSHYERCLLSSEELAALTQHPHNAKEGD